MATLKHLLTADIWQVDTRCQHRTISELSSCDFSLHLKCLQIVCGLKNVSFDIQTRFKFVLWVLYFVFQLQTSDLDENQVKNPVNLN